MAPIRKNTINHFTHPGHKLTEIKGNDEYNCDGCKLDGNGTRFNCSQCEFDLHEHCAKCPMTLTSHMHPSHLLRLIVHQVSPGTCYCHVCRNPIEGLVYQCTSKDCSFMVHPGCANSSSSDTPPRREQLQGAPAATATGTRQAGGAPRNNIAQRVAVGIATNAAYDGIKSTYEGMVSNSNGMECNSEGMESNYEGMESNYEGNESNYEGNESNYEGMESNSEEMESNSSGIKSFFKSFFESSSDY